MNTLRALEEQIAKPVKIVNIVKIVLKTEELAAFVNNF